MNTSYSTFTTSYDGNLTTVGNGRDVEIVINESLTSLTSNIIITIIVCIFIILGSVGNILTLIVIYKNKFLQIPSNYFIVSLCCSDLISALLCSPLWLYRRTWGFLKWEWGLGSCQVYWVADFTTNIATATHILTFSLVRYIAIKRPFAASSLTKKRVKIIIALLWAVSFLLTIPLLFWMGIDNFRFLNKIGKDWPSCSILIETNNTCCVTQYNTYMMVVGSVLFFIPEFLVILLSISIARVMLGRRKWMSGFANIYDITEKVQNINMNSRRQSTISSNQTTTTAVVTTSNSTYSTSQDSRKPNVTSKLSNNDDNERSPQHSNVDKKFALMKHVTDESKYLEDSYSEKKKSFPNEEEEITKSSNINLTFEHDTPSETELSTSVKSNNQNISDQTIYADREKVDLHPKQISEQSLDEVGNKISTSVPNKEDDINGNKIEKISDSNKIEDQSSKSKTNPMLIQNHKDEEICSRHGNEIESTKETKSIDSNNEKKVESVVEDVEKSFTLETENLEENNFQEVSEGKETVSHTTSQSSGTKSEIKMAEETTSFSKIENEKLEVNKTNNSGLFTQVDEIEHIKSRSTIKLQPSKRYKAESDNSPPESFNAKDSNMIQEQILNPKNTSNFPTIEEESEYLQNFPDSSNSAFSSSLHPPPNPVLYHRKGSTLSQNTDNNNRSIYRKQPRRTTATSERSDSGRNRRASSASLALERQHQLERTTFIQLSLVNISFVIGYIPITVYLMWTSNITTAARDPFTDYWFGVIAYLCLRLSECMNPVIYNLASTNMGNATRKMLRRAFGCGPTNG